MKWLLVADDWVNKAIAVGDSSGLFEARQIVHVRAGLLDPNAPTVCRVLISSPEGQDRHRQRVKA
tara:strand:- start:4232 stop:4426 length:195 start_codon:yes stop_codon:yes gene_type:complete